jgi:hypothetical protein
MDWPITGAHRTRPVRQGHVAYHFFNDFDTAPDQMAEIAKTYDGPLSTATDYEEVFHPSTLELNEM